MGKALSIMEIERFAIHDGPGIRTTVFLQGCPLRCRWCANPESQTIGRKVMHYSARCVGCGRCAAVCPEKAIRIQNGKAEINRERCVKCGICSKVCPNRAIRMSGEIVEVSDIVDTICRDRDYYDNSGGGVTVSGGEPFVQFTGFLELITQCKLRGMHVAIETCGQFEEDQLSIAMPYIDLFLFDIKHPSDRPLFEATGASLPIILRNLGTIAAADTAKIIIRVPVIPGFNDDDETIDKIFDVAVRNGIKRVHLLPYHTLGEQKYASLDREYTLCCVPMLKKSDLEQFAKRGTSRGLAVQIGG
ncbi:MAG: glycyl-radical enzyme activating protein [Oscillospiraceae bacterium]